MTNPENQSKPEYRDQFQAKASRLGGYSNVPSEYIREHQERRTQVQHIVGDYVLRLHPEFFQFEAHRQDGKPVPRPLRGQWQDIPTFRAALDKYEANQKGTE